MTLWPLLLSCSLAFSAPPVSATGSAVQDSTPLSRDDYKKGLDELRKYLETRGEKDAYAATFVTDLEKLQPPPPREVLAAFLKYEQAWARKTRDAKNAKVSKDQLQHEQQLALQLRNQFRDLARRKDPAFLDAFHGAVKDVRAQRAAKEPDGSKPGQPNSGALFADRTDDSYTNVDNGDEALDNGDAAAAAADAQQAIAENPANADAFALQAGAALAQGDTAAAQQAAQTALSLDPANQAAQAIASLAGGITPGADTLGDAGAIGGSLSSQSPAQPTASAVAAATELSPAPYASLAVPPPPPGTPPPPPASATPLLAASLASQVAQQAARTMNVDPAAGMQGIARAISLDPSNADIWRLQAQALQRAGAYRDALAAASRAEYLAPKDARNHYARAEALAFARRKDEMVDELRQAAALDSTYRHVADSAFNAPQDADLTLLYPDARAPLSAPVPQKHRHRRAWRRFWLVLAILGGLLIAGALVSAMLDEREARDENARRAEEERKKLEAWLR